MWGLVGSPVVAKYIYERGVGVACSTDFVSVMNSDNAKKYVQACIKIKNITKESEKTLLKDSLTNSLKVIYRAIALNIDVILTQENLSFIDIKLVSFIKDYLLRNGILVFLISSRGLEETVEVAKQIVTPNEDNIYCYQRLHCGAYNGATLLSTPPMSFSDNDLFSKRELLTHGGKCDAIETFGNKYGILKEQILRIGDHGSEGGNDFDMLNSEAGFSVGEISRAPNKCFPVINEKTGARLFGSQAVMHLISSISILSPISLNPTASSTSTTKEEIFSYFSKFEHIATNRAKAETENLSERLRICLGNLFPSIRAKTSLITIDDIFDKYSGGVLFRNWEAENLYKHNGEIISLFEIPLLERKRATPVKSCYSMVTNTGLIMRGTLYYFDMVDNNTNTSIDKYICMAVIFIEKCFQGLNSLVSSKDLLSSYKLLLFMLDNVRNILIQITNIFFQIDFLNRRILFPKNRPKIIFDKFLCPHTEIFYNILTDEYANWERTISEYKKLLGAIKNWLSDVDEDLRQTPVEIRKWRECDFFYQNVAAIQLIIRDSNCPLKHTGDNALYAVGLTYGGLELPAIATVVGNKYGYDIRPGLMRISIDNDNFKSTCEERIKIIQQMRTANQEYVENLKNSNHVLTLLDEGKIAGSNIFLLDDNCTTGITLQAARDYIYFLGGNFKGAGVVRLPGISHREQMAFAGNGFPDPEILFSLIRGFIPASQ